jgi:hypothetical protein
LSVSLDQTLRDWRDFYVMGGTAAATLVGLMFVFASVGASQVASRNLGAMRAFITPTVVHFGAALFVCLVSIMPGHSERSLGGVLGVGALIGVAYCFQILLLILRSFAAGLVWEDRLFYARRSNSTSVPATPMSSRGLRSSSSSSPGCATPGT